MITERTFAREVTANDILELVATQQAEQNSLEFKLTNDADLLRPHAR
jgi:hypothetical protein